MLCCALLQHQLPPFPAELPAPGKIGRSAGGTAFESQAELLQLAGRQGWHPLLLQPLRQQQAAAAVAPMARRTLGTAVHTVLEWAPVVAPAGSTRTAAGMEQAWRALALDSPAPVVLIGSAPTALEVLLQQVAAGAPAPSLVIGMPVGFVGVAESKKHLAASGLAQIRLESSRGGAGLVAAAVNALLRAAAAPAPPLSS